MAVPIEPRLAARREEIAALCRRFGVIALDVFGSAADGRFDPSSSDYDFIARFEPSEGGESLGRRYVAFSEALESLLGKRVDVMTDHPIANPYLRAAVAASRRPVYAQPAAQASA